jgi:8-oxo-dGTP pyrophosphatase MutT (NUDIX family)
MRTAQRETWEESGYKVRTGELLATVRNGFRIYRLGRLGDGCG